MIGSFGITTFQFTDSIPATFLFQLWIVLHKMTTIKLIRLKELEI